MNEKIIKSVTLNAGHVATDKAKHFLDGKLLGPAAKLEIVQNDDGYFLIYFDSAGNKITDTFHLSVTDAESQAMTEYLVKPEDWQVAD